MLQYTYSISISDEIYLMKSTTQNSSVLKSIFIGAIGGVILATAFVSGFYTRGFFPATPQVVAVPIDEQGYPLLDEVQSLIDRI